MEEQRDEIRSWSDMIVDSSHLNHWKSDLYIYENKIDITTDTLINAETNLFNIH